MVFPSVPVYLDPHPPNWQQQQGAGCSSAENHQLPPIVPPPPPPIGGGGTGSFRPGSMSERARLAKIPQPETSMKCPRCESTNTKFCYFNNYSLSQPRHFCKTCRRYWTRGGALRNVPVGGGCRRNKRSKRSRSKSPIMGDHRSTSTSTSAVSSNSCTTDLLGHLPPPPPQLPFFAPLHSLTDFGNADIGLNFCGIQPPVATRGGGSAIHEFQIGNTSAGGAGPLNLSGRFADQWKLHQVQQFPFLSGLEQPSGAYQFEGEAIHEPLGFVGGASDQLGSKMTLEVEASQLASVKLEDNHQGQNLSRNFHQGQNLSRNFSSVPGNDQYWTGNTWTDLSGSTSNAGHLM